ncbi:hypothetical protein Tco_1399148, partial [Tanacetum coccineum]
MKSYLDTLECLGYAMPNELGASLILNSLNKDYDQFIQNHNMHSMGKMIAEFHAMLKLHEKGISKKAETPIVLAIREAKLKKRKSASIASTSSIFTIEQYAFLIRLRYMIQVAKDSVCHHRKEVGHWKRNYPSCQSELKKSKSASIASTSSIFTIELYAFSNKTW